MLLFMTLGDIPGVLLIVTMLNELHFIDMHSLLLFSQLMKYSDTARGMVHFRERR